MTLGGTIPALAERAGISVSVGSPEDLNGSDADCLVITDETRLASLPADVGPVILYADVSPERLDRRPLDGFVRPPDVDGLVFQIRLAVSRGASREIEHVERLHEATTSLLEARTRAELFERTVDIARQTLGFDTCHVATVEDGYFVHAAGTGVTEMFPAPVDHGVLGESYQQGASALVRDVEDHPVAAWGRDEFRSGIVVPLADVGVFQALSTAPAAFDERDLRRAELLVTSVEATLTRIRSEKRLHERSLAIERLHEGTVTLASVRSADELWERTVEIADTVLEFDGCAVGVVDHDTVVPAAGSTDTSASASADAPTDGSTDTDREVRLDQRLAEETLSTGESRVVDRIEPTDGPDGVHGGYQSTICAPIGDVGVFQAVSSKPDGFDEDDRELVELLVTHVAETYTRIRAETLFDDRRRQVTRLYQGTVGLVTLRRTDDLYERAVEVADAVFEQDGCCLLLREGDQLVPRAASSALAGDEVGAIDIDHGVVGEAYRTGRARRVDGVGDDPDATPFSGTYGSGLIVPLGEYGVFQAVSARVDGFDEDDLALADLLMTYVRETLTRIHAENDLETRRETIESLHGATAEIVRCRDETELFDRAIEAAADVLAFDTSHVYRVRDEQFVPVASARHADHDAVGPLPLDHEVLGRCHASGESFLHGDVDSLPETTVGQPGFGSVISVPIGEYGVFQAVSTADGTFTRTDLEFAELFVSHVTATMGRIEAERELRTEHDRLSALFENVPDAVISYELVDGEPIVREINSAFEEVFGYRAEEIVGENIDDYVVPAPDDEAASEAGRRLKGGENTRMQCTRRTATGPREFFLQIVPLELGQRNAAGYAIYTDITEQIEREQELERQNERLAEFAHIVSHDLRNPLSIASGHLELARETGHEDRFDTVQSAHERMDRLIENLLKLARHGQIIGETSRVDLGELAQQAWAGVQTDEATLDSTASLTVDGDGARLLDLFENLFRNAVEHGGPTVTVTVEETETGFAVADDGPGVGPDQRETVFEPGVTTGTDGIGYGLPTVKRIVEAHGWTVTLTESATGGARFEVHLGEQFDGSRRGRQQPEDGAGAARNRSEDESRD